jgi:hypothetical protein
MKSSPKLLFGVIILMLLVSCAPTSKFLLPEEKEQIFSHEVQIKKEDIRTQVVQFINEKFVSGKSVTQSSEEGLIIGNGVFEIDRTNTVIAGTYIVKIELTFLVKYIEHQYKTKYIVKRVISTGANGLPTDAEERWWGYYKEQINKIIKDMDIELLDYLTKKDDKFKF